MSKLYTRIYRDKTGDYLAHRITSFSGPVSVVANNDPEDDSRDLKFCVETFCGEQLLVDAIFTDWPDALDCQACGGKDR